MYRLNCNERATIVYHIYSHLIERQKIQVSNLPVISIVNLFVGIVSLPNALFRRRVNESKGVHSAEFDDSSILQTYNRKVYYYTFSLNRCANTFNI